MERIKLVLITLSMLTYGFAKASELKMQPNQLESQASDTAIPKARFEFVFPSVGCNPTIQFVNHSKMINLTTGTPCMSSDSVVCDSIVAFQWDFGDGSLISTDKDPSHKYTINGWFTAKLLLYTRFGQIDSISRRFYVAGPQPSFNFINNEEYKAGDTVNICQDEYIGIINKTIEPISKPNWIIKWGDGSNGAFVSIKGRAYHRYRTTGIYAVSLIMDDYIEGTAIRCKQHYPDTSTLDGRKSNHFFVNVKPRPSVNAKVSDYDLEVGQKATFSYTPNPTYTSYKWFFGDGDSLIQTSIDTFAEHSYSRSGIFNVKLVPHSSSKMLGSICPDTSKLTIRVGTFHISTANNMLYLITPIPAERVVIVDRASHGWLDNRVHVQLVDVSGVKHRAWVELFQRI